MNEDDIRVFYNALGVELPGWATREAPCRCFADPDAHQNHDRDPSCSVNLETGVWYCHGCGAHGGAYDAALATGHTRRSAIDLMTAYGLTQRRTTRTEPRSASQPRRPRHERATVSARPRPQFKITDADVHRWTIALANQPAVIAALRRERGWADQALTELELGLDQRYQRITVPIRDHAGALQGLLRYRTPAERRAPKMLAAPGTRLGLIPHPDSEPSHRIVLVEGPPDMIAARSRGLPAIAVPGTSAWRVDWATQLAGRQITVIMDADQAGRDAAKQISADLRPHAGVSVIDLAPGRADGYDLTDHLLQQPITPPGISRAATKPQPPTMRSSVPRLEAHPGLRAT